MQLLFICSRNKWRSPTADRIWRRPPLIDTRSAGTSQKAKRRVTKSDIRWADAICVMEQKHKRQLLARFPRLLREKAIHVLDIPDDYGYMDPELVKQLEASVEAIFLISDQN